MGNYYSTEEPEAPPPSDTGYTDGYEEGYKAAAAALEEQYKAAASAAMPTTQAVADSTSALVQLTTSDPERSAEDQYLNMATYEYGKYGNSLGLPSTSSPEVHDTE
eukprot:9420463-Pyramimonas_sp.AAC.1